MTGGGAVPYPSYQDGTSPEEAEYIDAMQAATMIGVPTGVNQAAGTLPGLPEGTSPELAEYINAGRTGAMAGGTASPLAEYINAGRAAGRAGGTEAAQEAPEELSIEQRVAALAAKMGISAPEARAMILNQMLQERGLTLSDEVINQFATGSITLQDALAQAVGPPEMQAGTGLGEALSIDLFQQGDEEINEPLNRMAQAVSPSIADITPAEKVEETITLTEDQGPSTMDESLQKLPFQQMAIKIVEQADEILKQEDYMNIEEVEQQVQQELTAIDEQYRLQTGAADSILTEEFLTLLDRITTNTQDEFDTAPGMAEGGISGDEEDMEAYIRSLGGGASADPDEVKRIIKRYLGSASSSSDLQAKKQALARRSALLGGKTKQGGWAGMMDILGQADAAEAAALGELPRQLSANEAALERLAMETETALYGGTRGTGMTAEGKNLLILKKIMTMPDSEDKNMLLDRLNVDTESKTILNYAEKIARDLGSKTPQELRTWKKLHGFENDKNIIEIAVKQATDLINAIKGGSTPPPPAATTGGNPPV
jgi:hypothetical protein